MSYSGRVSALRDHRWSGAVLDALAVLGKSLGADSALLLRVRRGSDSGIVEIAWSAGPDGAMPVDPDNEISLSGTLLKRAIANSRNGEPTVVSVDDPNLVSDLGLLGDSAMAVSGGESPEVVVVLAFPGQPKTTSEQSAQLRSFCALAGSIYERHRSEIELRGRLRVDRILSSVAQKFAEADVESAESEIDAALRQLGHAIGCMSLNIWDDGDDELVHRSHVWVNPKYGTVDDYSISVIPLDHPISTRIRSVGESNVIRFSDHFNDSQARHYSIIAAPLLNEGIVSGAVTVGFADPTTSAADTGLDKWTSTALGIAALVAQLRHRVSFEQSQRRARNVELFASDLARLFLDASSNDNDRVLEAAMEMLAAKLGASSVGYYEHGSSDEESSLVASWTADPTRSPPPASAPTCGPHIGMCETCGRFVARVESEGEVVGTLLCDLGDSRVHHDDVETMLFSASSLITQFRRRVVAERLVFRRQEADRVLREVAAELVGAHADVGRALDRLAAGLGVRYVSLWRDASGPQPATRTRIECMARSGGGIGRSHAYLPASIVSAYPAPGELLEYPLDFVPSWLESVVGEKLQSGSRNISIAVTQIDADELVGLFVVSHGLAPTDQVRQEMLVHAVALLAQHQARLAAEVRFSSAFESAPNPITMRDSEGVLIACNEAYLEFTGRSRSEVIGRMVEDSLADGGDDVEHPRVGDTVELPYRRPDGSVRWGLVQFNSVVIAGRAEPVLLSHIRDITETRQTEQLILHRATHDSLTELPNRDGFFGSFGPDQSTVGCAVLVVDLDNFGSINDTLGHHIGDMALITASDRMRLTLRPEDKICRLGGDEFAIHMSGGVTEREVSAVAARLLAMMQEPMRLGGQEVNVTMSIGAVMGSATHGVPELVRFADTAMYHAKKHGRDRYVMFDDQLRQEVAAKLNLESELRSAFRLGQFDVHYQPEVELLTGRVLGTEALVRWNHPDRGLLPAGAFIEVAEECGLIVDLGLWVLSEATKQAASWHREGHDLMMRVNLSTRQLRPAVVGEIRDALLTAGLRPQQLCLEVTETAIMDDVAESMRLLRQISKLGVKLAIDDFGTGYSSLAYLKRFPVDILKIDKAFVDGVGLNDQDTGIVDTVIRLGRALGLDVVAEGIENSQQVHDLVELGCRRGQGFHLARPSSAAATSILLESAPRN